MAFKHLYEGNTFSLQVGGLSVSNANANTVPSNNSLVVGNSTVNTEITSTSINTDGTLTVAGNTLISGNLTVQGTTTTVNSATLDVTDKNITVAKSAADSAAADGAGLTVDGASATFNYSHSGTKWTMNKPLDITGTLTVSGNSTLTGNVTASDDLAVSGDATVTGNVTAAAIKKDGGTSSQFLKADGSVDTSTYLTASTGNSFGGVMTIVTASNTNLGANTSEDHLILEYAHADYSGGEVTIAVNHSNVSATPYKNDTYVRQMLIVGGYESDSGASDANANSKIQEIKTLKSHGDLISSITANSDSGNVRLYINQTNANSSVKVVAQLMGW
tara:strand:- start:491 stop:1486 length:996 start_codon:yes stop_codon:yes gene_type:complete